MTIDKYNILARLSLFGKLRSSWEYKNSTIKTFTLRNEPAWIIFEVRYEGDEVVDAKKRSLIDIEDRVSLSAKYYIDRHKN